MKNKWKILLISGIIFSTILSWCYQDNNIKNTNTNSWKNNTKKESWDTVWKYTKNINTPIKAKSSKTEDIKLWDILKDKIEVTLTKWSLETDADITLENPSEVPNIVGEDFKTIGAPIELWIGKPIRLDEKATIRFAFDKSSLPADTKSGSLRVVYYNGQDWSSIKPDNIDMDLWIVTFSSYHFSLFWLNQIDSEKKITEEWIHSQILDNELKNNLNEMSDHVTNQIIDLTLEKMGLSDKDLKTKILQEVLKEDWYKKIYNSYKSWDVIELNQKIALLAWKKIAEIVPESKFKEALWWLWDAAEDIAEVSKAAWYAAEWNYTEAAKIIGTQITDKFIIWKAWKLAVDAINYQIWAWKSSEIEAAYNAYKDWANGKFWWYNVDKWDFDDVWDQMRWIRRQLEIEAVKNENKSRSEAWLPSLTTKQSELVKAWLKESFRRQFATRNKREEEFKKQEEIMHKLVDWFKDAWFFDSSKKPIWLDKWLGYENELSVLYHFAQKMMRDTKRSELIDLKWLTIKDKIFINDVVQWARFWFWPDWPKKYAQFLKDRFNIVIAPDITNLVWLWSNWAMNIKDVIAPKVDKSKSSSNWWCDISIDLNELKWKVLPISFNISSNWPNSWIINLDFKDWKIDPFPFTYNNWILKWSFSKDWWTINLELQISEWDKNFLANWTLNIIINAQFKIFTDLKISKEKIIPPSKQQDKNNTVWK